MKEKNKNTLQQAIRQLPRHRAPGHLWDQMEDQLDRFKNENLLETVVQQLPSHQPSADLWDRIEQELPTEQIKDSGHNSSLVSRVHLIRSVAAALLFLLAGWGIWTWQQSSSSDIVLQYSTEEVSEEVWTPDWETDEDAFQMVLAFCLEQILVCEQPDFRMLKEELEELNVAREQVKSAIDTFGSDQHMIAHLTEIEMERSRILKLMISKI